MDGWIDGWMDQCMDGRSNAWMDIWADWILFVGLLNIDILKSTRSYRK